MASMANPEDKVVPLSFDRAPADTNNNFDVTEPSSLNKPVEDIGHRC